MLPQGGTTDVDTHATVRRLSWRKGSRVGYVFRPDRNPREVEACTDLVLMSGVSASRSDNRYAGSSGKRQSIPRELQVFDVLQEWSQTGP